ncbi:hypothetical protein Pcinc_004098 [Petrolisthes cinctipes]|uniref:Uncharacterized protein n=1 Tax=Petrolisthes cinctipes TaxID=88211 RepID=A0AAE1GL99_PETCI|nr:hypothetical protein Pcinc_004506 [Petrolisthes cinctipes]KAK3892131.1 hypothetical protein Pcinc_004098 [Petrolisthes cinctipes]
MKARMETVKPQYKDMKARMETVKPQYKDMKARMETTHHESVDWAITETKAQIEQLGKRFVHGVERNKELEKKLQAPSWTIPALF